MDFIATFASMLAISRVNLDSKDQCRIFIATTLRDWRIDFDVVDAATLLARKIREPESVSV